jgi:hypothetical protein
MDNVPAIVPLLEREHRVAENRLGTSKKELDDLATDKLKVNWPGQCRPNGYCGTLHNTAIVGVSMGAKGQYIAIQQGQQQLMPSSNGSLQQLLQPTVEEMI